MQPARSKPITSSEEHSMRRFHFCLRHLAIVVILIFATLSVSAQAQLSADLQTKIDKLVMDGLASSGVPSASVVCVKDGQIVYAKAYGDARLEPRTAATSEMRYSIGSISKQFTASAILLLQ